jgi:hypothetical protein
MVLIPRFKALTFYGLMQGMGETKTVRLRDRCVPPVVLNLGGECGLLSDRVGCIPTFADSSCSPGNTLIPTFLLREKEAKSPLLRERVG